MSEPTGKSNASSASESDVALVYDGECPVCTAYGCSVDLAEGQLNRVNARENGDIVAEITAAGLNLDDGMVVKHGGRLYHGADALHIMALHGSRRGLTNRFNHLLFRSKTRSHLLYPAMRAGRNMLLRLLGREKIDNLKQSHLEVST